MKLTPNRRRRRLLKFFIAIFFVAALIRSTTGDESSVVELVEQQVQPVPSVAPVDSTTIATETFEPTPPEAFISSTPMGLVCRQCAPSKPRATFFNSEHHALVLRATGAYVDGAQTSAGGTFGGDLYFRLGDGWGTIASTTGTFLDDGTALGVNVGVFRVPRLYSCTTLPRVSFAAVFDHFSENFIANSNASQVRVKLGYALKPDLFVGFNYVEPVSRTIGVIQNPAGGPLAIPVRMNQQFGGYVSGWLGPGRLNLVGDFAYLRDIDSWSVGGSARAPLTDRCTAISSLNYADNGTWVANTGIEFSLGRRRSTYRCANPCVYGGGVVRGEAPNNVGTQFVQQDLTTEQIVLQRSQLQQQLRSANDTAFEERARIDEQIAELQTGIGMNETGILAFNEQLKQLSSEAEVADTEEERNRIAELTKDALQNIAFFRERTARSEQLIADLRNQKENAFAEVAQIEAEIARLEQLLITPRNNCIRTTIALLNQRRDPGGVPFVSPQLSATNTANEVNSVFGGPLGGVGLTEYVRYVSEAQNQANLAFQQNIAAANAAANANANTGNANVANNNAANNNNQPVNNNQATNNNQAAANNNTAANNQNNAARLDAAVASQRNVAGGENASAGATAGSNPCGPGEYYVPGVGCLPCPSGTVPYDSNGDGVPDQCIIP